MHGATMKIVIFIVNLPSHFSTFRNGPHETDH